MNHSATDQIQPTHKMNLIQIYFDGGTGPTNPGKGYGSYEIVSEHINRKVERRQFGEPITSNQAEYLSLIAALEWLVHQTEDDINTHLRIYSDSKLVVMQVQGSWKARVEHVKELRDQARNLLAMFTKWEIHWRPRELIVKRFGH